MLRRASWSGQGHHCLCESTLEAVPVEVEMHAHFEFISEFGWVSTKRATKWSHCAPRCMYVAHACTAVCGLHMYVLSFLPTADIN